MKRVNEAKRYSVKGIR